jgi:predicted alpha/beta-fold hydrolase
MTDEPSATQTLRDTPREYMAPAWLPGGQMQTIYAYYLKLTPAFAYRRERWDTPDGDFIDLDWLDGFTRESKLLVLFHGLEGCSRSHYAVSLMNQLRGEGWWNRAAFSWLRRRDQPIAAIYHAADSAEVD